MAVPPNYQIIIVNSSGVLTEFNNAVNIAWEWYENEVGRCRFSIAWNDQKLSDTSVENSAFNEIRIYRDNVLVWQGFIAYIVDGLNETTVYGLTFLETLKWYGVGYNIPYVDQRIGSQIIDPIYDDILLRTNDFLTARITKGTIQNTTESGVGTPKSITRTTYNESFFALLKEMVAISRSDSPQPPWKQDTVFEITFDENTPTFNFWKDIGIDQIEVIYELDSEIVNFNLHYDFRSIFNDITGYGIEDGPRIVNSNQVDVTSRTAYYLREFYPYFGSVSSQDETTESVKNTLGVLKDPAKIISVELAAGLVPFDGYVMGDNINVRINRGRVVIDEFFRVIGMEVSLSDTGVEKTIPLLERKRTV